MLSQAAFMKKRLLVEIPLLLLQLSIISYLPCAGSTAIIASNNNSSDNPPFCTCPLECQQNDDATAINNNHRDVDVGTTTNKLRIRAGVLLAVPFLLEEEVQYDDTITQDRNRTGAAIVSVQGLQSPNHRLVGLLVDLMNELQQIALEEDNIELQFDLDILRHVGYSTAISLLNANSCQDQDADHPWNNNNTDTLPEQVWKNDNNATLQQICNRYDALIADYWARPDRFNIADFTPSWLGTSVGLVKYIGGDSSKKRSGRRDINTMSELIRYNQKVCVQENSATPNVLSETFLGNGNNNNNNNLTFQYCQSTVEGNCFQQLKEGKCALYAADELKGRYNARLDPGNLDVTRERIRPQKLVWPIRRPSSSQQQQQHEHLHAVAFYLKRWIYSAEQRSILERLNIQYFSAQLCPIGTAGENCTLPCHPIHGTSDRQGRCVCESTRYQGPDCSIERQTDHSLVSTALIGVGLSLFGVNALICIACGIWLWQKRKTVEVCMAQPMFLGMVLLGCVVSSSTIIALSQQDDPNNEEDAEVTLEESSDDNVACMAIPVLYSVGFCITFGSLFAKIYRVLVLFNSAAAMRRIVVTVNQTLLWISCLLLVDAIILTVWGVVDPLTWERVVVEEDKFGYPLKTRGYCTSEHWEKFAATIAALHLLLLLLGSWCCYMARNIPTEFSEGRYVAIAMVSNLQIFAVGLPVLIIVGGTNASTSYFVPTIMIWLNDFVVVAIIFGNLIYSVHFGNFQGDNNNGHDDGSQKSTHSTGSNGSVHAAISQFRKSPRRGMDTSSGRTSMPGSTS